MTQTQNTQKALHRKGTSYSLVTCEPVEGDVKQGKIYRIKMIQKISPRSDAKILKEVFGGKYRFDGETEQGGMLSFISEGEWEKIREIDAGVTGVEKGPVRISKAAFSGYHDDVLEVGERQAQKNWGGGR